MSLPTTAFHHLQNENIREEQLIPVVPHIHTDLVYYSYRQFETSSDILFNVITSRLGGVSLPPYESLNLSLSGGDEREAVLHNRSLLFDALHLDATSVAIAQLDQGTRISIVESDPRQWTTAQWEEHLEKTDSLITNLPGIPLMILVADCIPVTFFDPVRHIAALVHCGWRGTLGNIVNKTLVRMRETFGSCPEDVLVGLGPGARRCCFEVKDDVLCEYRAAFPSKADFFIEMHQDETAYLDIPAAIRWQLLQSGIREKHIQDSGICTMCNTHLFYSHRDASKRGGKTGRFACIVMLR